MSRHLGWIGLAIALAACSRPAAPPRVWDSRGGAARARLSEEEIAGLGHDLFVVRSFEAETESRREVVDEYAVTGLYEVPFRAELELTRDVLVEGDREIGDRVGEPGWTIDVHHRATALMRVLGPGPRRAGARFEIHAIAVFEDLEPGWRFRALDTRSDAP